MYAQTMPVAGGPILHSDFNVPGSWSAAPTGTASGGAVVKVTRRDAGTIDAYRGAPTPALVLSADFTKAQNGARAALATGVQTVRNTESDPAMLTLSFDLWIERPRPVRVVAQSFNAAGKLTGSRFTTVVPPVGGAYYRFSVDLDKTRPLEGRFDALAPKAQFVFEINDADEPVARTPDHTLRVDNVSYSAPSYYVSPDGSDTADGRSARTAFATLQKAADAAQPGDMVLVMNGTYASRPKADLVTLKKAGRPDGWIVLRAHPGHAPVLTGDGWNVVSLDHQSAYIEIRGLTVRGKRRELSLEDALAESKKSPPNSLYNTNGIALDARKGVEQNGKAHHIRIIGNTVADMPGGGISAIAGDYVTVEGNHVYDNCHLMRYAGSGISIFRAWDFDADTGYKNFVIGNRAHGNRCFVPWTAIGKISDGNGIIIDDFINYQQGASKIPYEGRTLVQNNLSFGNGGSGIHAYASNHVDIVNNTAYHNVQSPELQWRQIFAGGRCTDVRIVNNILWAQSGKPVGFELGHDSSDILYAHNLDFGDGGNGLVTGGGLGAERAGRQARTEGNLTGRPGFATPSLDPFLADFRLAPGSAAIDAGTTVYPGVPRVDLDGKPRPQGKAVDIGAYERALMK